MSRPFSFTLNLLLFKISQKIFLLLGLAPYRVTTEVGSRKFADMTVKFSYSKIGCVYNIFLLVIITLMILLWPATSDWAYPDDGFSSIGKNIDAGLALMGNLVGFMTVLIYCIYQQHLVEIGNQLNEFNNKFKVQLRNDGHHWRDFDYALIILPFLLTAAIIAVNHGTCYGPISLFFYFMPGLVVASFMLKYTLIIRFLKKKAEGINAAFSRARTMIYKIAKEISEFHGLPSLLIISYASCGCVDMLYFLINYITIGKNSGVGSVALNCILWIFFLMYPIFILSETVKRFDIQMKRTADILYHIKEMYLWNKKITSEMADFAVELLHKQVVFSAYGFFPLDCTLLHSVRQKSKSHFPAARVRIIGMVVTYLIICLQFEPTDIPAK